MKLRIERTVLIDGLVVFAIKSDVSPEVFADRENPALTDEEALQLSIDKWKLIVAIRRGDADVGIIEGGRASCGLCVRHYRFGNNCGACPVSKQAGTSDCRLTPYTKWGQVASLENAEKELAFLESLQKSSSLIDHAVKVRRRDGRGRFIA